MLWTCSTLAIISTRAVNMVEYVVDFQSLKRSSNLLQVKELAVIPVENRRLPTICLFRSPCDFNRLTLKEQKTNIWLERHYHGIPWRSGFVPYNSWIRVIQDALRDASRIYVKGLEKKRLLEMVVPGILIVDMSEIFCPSPRFLEKSCSFPCNYHPLRAGAVCAVENVYSLRTWLLNRREQILQGRLRPDKEEHQGTDELDKLFREVRDLTQEEEQKLKKFMHNDPLVRNSKLKIFM